MNNPDHIDNHPVPKKPSPTKGERGQPPPKEGQKRENEEKLETMKKVVQYVHLNVGNLLLKLS
jgi:hypothetical protein